MSDPLLRSLERAGFVAPAAREGATGYSFQDLLMLRTASALNAANISVSKITAALKNIRSSLPPGAVVAALAVDGRRGKLDLGDATQAWTSQPDPSAQIAPDAAMPVAVKRGQRSASAQAQAQAHYARGHALEDSDVEAARAAYLAALDAYADHLEARINLGRLLHESGDLRQAEKVYRQAKSSSALLSFNLAILLEDLNREEEAIAAYREALAQDPSLHDAHFNLSRLHEKAQRPREALRHLLAFRRHLIKYGG